MNVLLLGNGFDLYYDLPTKYVNFLNTAEHLINNTLIDINNVGQIFSNKKLQDLDPFIERCYITHKNVFNKTKLEMQTIMEMTNLLRENMWFLYLTSTYNKDVGWIDFEKEIAFVLNSFQNILSACDNLLRAEKLKRKDVFILECFNFFLDTQYGIHPRGAYEFKREYQIEYPLHSGIFSVDKEKVIKTLKESLLDLEKALQIYLLFFVENTCDLLCLERKYDKIKIFSNINNVITFNYTNTFEKLYLKSTAFHLHGSVNGRIILGVNPDESDLSINIDTTFIDFKKYFKRALNGTDHDYLNWISKVKNNSESYRLIVMGHSLDVTDKDIIIELFEYANDIIVLYHNEDRKRVYMENLIRLFGKEEFDSLRREKGLRLLPQDMDFSEMAAKMEHEAWNEIIRDIDSNKGETIEIV